MGFKIAKVCLAKRIKKGEELYNYSPEIVKPEFVVPESAALAVIDE